ncbi:MAG: nucleotide exchange factor GrpE [Bacteroidota bacterium]
MEQEVKDQNEEINEKEIIDNEGQSSAEPADESSSGDAEEEVDPIEALENSLKESKDKYLRLYSEFENFRRRTSKEKMEIISTASKDLMTDLLPVLDDFDRAMGSEGTGEGTAAEGLQLISQKIRNILESKGLKPMEVKQGDEFDDEFHEAITQIPAPKPELAGKIVDVVEKGYFMNEKVIRFARVVTGAKN